MDTNLTKVVTCPADEAEFKIRSLAAQGYTLTHLAATQASGIMTQIMTVLVFARSKEAAMKQEWPMSPAQVAPLSSTPKAVQEAVKRSGKK